jgi:hypothetical protein
LGTASAIDFFLFFFPNYKQLFIQNHHCKGAAALNLQHVASMAAGLHLGNFWPWIPPTHLKFVPFQPGQVGFQVSQVETAF